MKYIIEAYASYDPPQAERLPKFIGPFRSDEAAIQFMTDEGPLYGSWMVVQLAAPSKIRRSRRGILGRIVSRVRQAINRRDRS